MTPSPLMGADSQERRPVENSFLHVHFHLTYCQQVREGYLMGSD